MLQVTLLTFRKIDIKKINAYNKLIIVVFTNEMYYMSELKFPIVENW